jgi:hypothetical protein
MIVSAPRTFRNFLQAVLEAFLVPVRADGGLGIGGGHQRVDPALADAFRLRLGGHFGLPAFILAAGVAATGRLGRDGKGGIRAMAANRDRRLTFRHLCLEFAPIY